MGSKTYSLESSSFSFQSGSTTYRISGVLEIREEKDAAWSEAEGKLVETDVTESHSAVEQERPPLIPLAKFIKNGRCPVNPRWLIFQEGSEMETYGAIVKYGRKWLVDEAKFFDYLRGRGR